MKEVIYENTHKVHQHSSRGLKIKIGLVADIASVLCRCLQTSRFHFQGAVCKDIMLM